MTALETLHTSLHFNFSIIFSSHTLSTHRYDGVEFGLRTMRAVDRATVREMITGSRGLGLGSEVRRRILTGAFTLSRTQYDSYYVKAQRVRRLVCQDFVQAFADGGGGGEGSERSVHVLLTPTTCGPAPRLADARAMPQLDVLSNDVFTVPASLAGLPAISVPWRTRCTEEADSNSVHGDGRRHQSLCLPIGLQLIGPRGCEEDVLRVAQVLEDEAGGAAATAAFA